MSKIKKAKRKGFTLVELIVSIAILAAIALVIGLNYNKIFDTNEKQSYNEFVNKIKSAADAYLISNNSLLTELNTNRSFIQISLKALKEVGLISPDLINPKTGELFGDNEVILVSLDEAGVLKFTYPTMEIEEHLQTLNKVIDYDSEFDCLADLDTVNLGLIDKNGNLVKDYFKDNLDKITCKTEEIDTKTLGKHLVKYSYITQGITKEGVRNYIVTDNINPRVTNIKYSPIIWTKDSVTITATISDNESGISAYAINLNKCDNFIPTINNEISGDVLVNGTYSVCAKDSYGNTTEEKITITNIDKTGPDIANINKNTEEWLTSITISSTITDNESKLVAYAINQTSNVSNVTWTNISSVTSKSVNQEITVPGTYYIWAKDGVGNISYKSILVNNIGIPKTISFNTTELSSSTYNGNYNTGSTVKGIKSISVNTGEVVNYSYSGTIISYSLKNGRSYTGTMNDTCSYSASYTSASYYSQCNSYYCPSGGSLSGSTCTGSSWSGGGRNDYECRNGSWVSTYNSNNVVCGTGYSKTYSCGSAPSGSCTNGASRSVPCSGTCHWGGNYSASCSGYTSGYTCPSGYTRSGTSCYRCSSGGSLSGSTCYYSCSYSYTYYRYTVTIEYYV